MSPSAELYQAGVYQGLSMAEIRQKIMAEGFDPLCVEDHAGYVYPVHDHPETKLLVFLAGGMRVTAGGQVFECRAGDRLIIPGKMPHAAVVHPDGCVYFWSEKLLD